MEVEVQLLIRFYKSELRRTPDCIATKALLARSRARLMKMKGDLDV